MMRSSPSTVNKSNILCNFGEEEERKNYDYFLENNKESNQLTNSNIAIWDNSRTILFNKEITYNSSRTNGCTRQVYLYNKILIFKTNIPWP